MKAFFVLLLAAMTAWVAFTADQMESAHKAVRISAAAGPAEKQLHALVEQYGGRQVLLAIVGLVAGLVLAFTVVMKLLKLLAFLCVIIMAIVLWQAWEHGYLADASRFDITPFYWGIR